MNVLSTSVPTRREVYRAFVRRFNPAADAESCFKADLIEWSLASERLKRMTSAVLLRPGSQHLLIGGIGSGKSTELKLLQEDLKRADRALVPLLIDVSRFADLQRSQAGSILLTTGLALEAQRYLPADLSNGLQEAFQQIQDIAFGYSTWEEPERYSEHEPSDEELAGLIEVDVPGKIFPPTAVIKSDVQAIAQLIAKVKAAFDSAGQELVLLLDGMDRLLEAKRFWEYVDQDFAAFRDLKISVVAASPLSLLHAAGQNILDRFDTFQHIPAIPISGQGLDLLRRVLQRRQASELIAAELQDKICRGSGGILRDLISIVNEAAQNAYLDSQDEIAEEHVEAALVQLGQGYKLGLGKAQLTQIRGIRSGAPFFPSTQTDFDLLVHRRIIMHADRYEVHPALLRVLDSSE